MVAKEDFYAQLKDLMDKTIEKRASVGTTMDPNVLKQTQPDGAPAPAVDEDGDAKKRETGDFGPDQTRSKPVHTNPGRDVKDSKPSTTMNESTGAPATTKVEDADKVAKASALIAKLEELKGKDPNAIKEAGKEDVIGLLNSLMNEEEASDEKLSKEAAEKLANIVSVISSAKDIQEFIQKSAEAEQLRAQQDEVVAKAVIDAIDKADAEMAKLASENEALKAEIENLKKGGINKEASVLNGKDLDPQGIKIATAAYNGYLKEKNEVEAMGYNYDLAKTLAAFMQKEAGNKNGNF